MLKTIPAAKAKNKFGLLMDTVQRGAVAIVPDCSVRLFPAGLMVSLPRLTINFYIQVLIK